MKDNKELFKEKSKQTFDNEANVYDTTYSGKHAKKLYNAVIEKVNQMNHNSILDIGFGTGTVLSMLANKENIRLCGIDISEKMLHIAREKLIGKAELILGDSEHLPWKENEFDIVLCIDSFHHYPNPEKVLSEIRRVLKPNGNIIIADPWVIPIVRQILNKLSHYGTQGDYRIYSKADISNLLSENKFRKINWNLLNLQAFLVTAEVGKT